MRRRVILLVAGACVLAGVGVTQTNATASAKLPEPPNVVLIVTDDQPRGTLDAMPVTRQELFTEGVRLTGMIPTSLCCPSRAALLSGLLAHTTGVYTNGGEWGGWQAFLENEDATLATALDDAGYRTGLFGKYLNGWRSEVPPGWDVFRAFEEAKYYNYVLDGTGGPVAYGADPDDYSTDVVADLAVEFVQSDEPVFAYVAPFAPHGPMIPAPRHDGAWPLVARSEIAAFNENDMSDKPDWVQRPKLNGFVQRRLLTRQHETLMAVDEMVDRLLAQLRGEDTLFVYLSDNGYMNGSHRLRYKDVPYSRSTHVPMAIRWDGHLRAVTKGRLTTNVDLTQTILDAAGVEMPGDGVSVFDRDRTATLLEQMSRTTREGWRPAYCGIRTKRYLFVEYDQGQGRELYDYAVDPEELDNRVADRQYADVRKRLRERAMALCSPVPPGFTW